MPLVTTTRRNNQRLLKSGRPTRPVEHLSYQPYILGIGILTMSYNGLLAALLSAGFPINGSFPTVIEIVLLIGSAFIALKDGLEKSSIIPLSLIYSIILTALLISIQGETIYVVSVRNFLIISVFTILGGKCSFNTLKLLFLCCSLITLLVLTIEVISIESYVKIFEPAQYLAATRGMAQSEYSGGLSAGTILYEGRFSLGLYSGPRTSSIFLEQVSINCFAIVIAFFLLVFWPTLKRRETLIHALTIFAILATNNARMAIILSIAFAVGYSLFSKLPKYTNIVIMPGILLGLYATFLFAHPAAGDDLLGRMSTTYNLLTSMNLSDLLMGNFSQTARSMDSGYGFLIYSTTLFGLVLYWLFISFVTPQVDGTSKRCAWGLGIYIGVWLLVGGTGTFSMKTAPLLWMAVGFVRARSLNVGEKSSLKTSR